MCVVMSCEVAIIHACDSSTILHRVCCRDVRSRHGLPDRELPLDEEVGRNNATSGAVEVETDKI